AAAGRRYEPSAEHTVELGDARGNPLRFLGLHVREPEHGLRRRLRRRRSGEHVFDERPELAAAWTPAEPATRGVAAVGARELNSRLRHERRIVAAGPDDFVPPV